jgi:uncharacterized protein (TIGR03437 family)
MKTLSAVLVLYLSAAPFLHGDVSQDNTVVGVVSYGTYFGGSSGTVVTAMAADAAGNAYLTGSTQSADLPVTRGSYQPVYPVCPASVPIVCSHGFVTKISPDGKLLWSTYLGGSAYDAGAAIAVDANGNVYVAGGTNSADFPTTPDALAKPATTGGGFVAKLDASGSQLLYSTFIPGGNELSPITLALGPQGTLVATGSTTSTSLPTVNALQPQFPGGNCGNKFGPYTCTHAYFAGWQIAGMKLLFASYLGGTGIDVARGAAVDGEGNIYLVGNTNSLDFPLHNALQQTAGAGECADNLPAHYPSICPDAFVTKLTPDGKTMVFSTRLGGSLADSANVIVLDSSGDAVVAGTSASPDFPLIHAAEAYPGSGTCISDSLAGGNAPCPHAFAAKLEPDGSALIYSTFMSGLTGDLVTSAAADSAGNFYVAGYTEANDFPVTNGAVRHCNASYDPRNSALLGNDGTDGMTGGGFTGFLAELSGSGALVFSTYFGGSGVDTILGLGLAGNSGIYMAGATGSPDLPTTVNAIQRQSPSYTPPSSVTGQNALSGFLVKLSLNTVQSLPPQIDSGCILNSASFQAGAIAPGELVSLFGSGLGPAAGAGAMLDAQGRVATQLAGASVTFDNIPAPLLYVGANQINAVVPFGVAGSSATQIVATVNGAAAVASAQVAAVAPGIFTVDLTGAGQAVVLNQDGTLNSSAHPAARGSVLTLWVTGLGMLSQSYADGEIVTGGLGSVTNSFTLNLVGPAAFPMDILYAGQAPDMVAGAVQLNARIPNDVQPFLTQVDFILQVSTGGGTGDSVFANPVTIWLEAVPS